MRIGEVVASLRARGGHVDLFALTALCLIVSTMLLIPWIAAMVHRYRGVIGDMSPSHERVNLALYVFAVEVGLLLLLEFMVMPGPRSTGLIPSDIASRFAHVIFAANAVLVALALLSLLIVSIRVLQGRHLQ